MQKIWIYLLLILFLPLSTLAQEGVTQSEKQKGAKEKQTGKNSEKKGEKKAKFLFVPGPLYRPDTGVGIMLIPMVMYQIGKNDTVSPPSVTSLVGLITSNKTWIAGTRSKLYFKEDDWRIEFFLFYADAKQTIRTNSNSSLIPAEIDFRNQVGEIQLNAQRRVWRRLYLGLQYDVTWSRTQAVDSSQQAILDKSGAFSSDFETTQSPSLIGSYDSRDNQFSATKGVFIESGLHQAIPGISSSLFGTFEIGYNQYYSPLDGMILAWRGFYYITWGDTPYYAMANFGGTGGSDLRGYIPGTYLGKNQIDWQFELRYYFYKKLGFAAFAGLGTVTDGISNLGDAPFLYSVGLGLRFMIDEESHLPIKLDVAYGRDGVMVYFGVSEAF